MYCAITNVYKLYETCVGSSLPLYDDLLDVGSGKLVITIFMQVKEHKKWEKD